jgi:hypothetical protein
MKMIESGESKIKLRRTFTPYVGLVYINAIITLFEIYASYKMMDWSFLRACLWLYLISIIYVLDATRYRISWDVIGVTMYTDWGKRTIKYEEMRSVKYETGSGADGKYLTRPFRRIVIHGNRKDSKAFVDVSLRHFEPKDISDLLREINRRRPELTIPWQPVCRSGELHLDFG